MIPEKLTFNLEGSDKPAAFFALYAGLRMYKEQRQKRVPADQMSIAAAEAFCMMEQLKDRYPKEYKEAEAEYNLAYEDMVMQKKNAIVVDIKPITDQVNAAVEAIKNITPETAEKAAKILSDLRLKLK